MEKKQTKTSIFGDFLYGYIEGRERQLITNTVEQIAAFIMSQKHGSMKIVNFLDELEIEVVGGFIFYCKDQKFLQNELIPVLVPMQLGERETITFVPYTDPSYTVKNMRFYSKEENMFMLVNLNFLDEWGHTVVSGKYKTEEELIAAYPNSISQKEGVRIGDSTRLTVEEFIEEITYNDMYMPKDALKEILGMTKEQLENLMEQDTDIILKQVRELVEKFNIQQLNDLCSKHELYFVIKEK